jgi:type I restriction enzyme S subunit
MQQIFSQELRFKDDDGQEFPEWEEKTLGEICSIVTGKLDANAMVENGEYRFYTCAKQYYQIDNYSFDTDALLISGNGANVGYIHHYKGKFNAYQRTYVLDGFQQNILFMKYFLDIYLYARILTEMQVYLPALKEQTKIANFLTAIDEKITNNQTQLDAVKHYKQGLLQQMFV